ncbi:Zinc finger CCCH domain-containing protein 37 [Trypanosoma brucei equiperdum]|uniref:Zinc finger CCCH domain-containing protein 37 n=1 Tax=Trypanosoma brucei equiperdum TaxID=630700 RepID=A0A3L6L1J8_9TRYP|nr:Zinc finger CCCH domain-containing protein 37 [Trypanosoma brucei equiperdum]
MPSKKSMAKNRKTTVEVFDIEFRYMYEIPSHSVVHMPHVHPSNPYTMICTHYKPHDPNSCLAGSDCRFLHANVDYSTLKAHPIHVNYIWRHESECTYERCQSGDVLEVLLPNNKKPIERIASGLVLVTQAVIPQPSAEGRPLSHCAHYYFNGVCHRGASCNFVHAVAVDPEVDLSSNRILCRSHRRHHASGNKSGEKLSAGSPLDSSPGSFPDGTPLGFAMVVHKRVPSVGSSDVTSPTSGRDNGHLGLSGSGHQHDDCTTSDMNTISDGSAPRRPRFYRHNPYGL